MNEVMNDLFELLENQEYSDSDKVRLIRSGKYNDQFENVQDHYVGEVGSEFDLTGTPLMLAAYTQSDSVVSALLDASSCELVSKQYAQSAGPPINAFVMRYFYNETTHSTNSDVIVRIIRCHTSLKDVMPTGNDTLLAYLFNDTLPNAWNTEPLASLIVELLSRVDSQPMVQFHGGFSPFVDAVSYAHTRPDILKALIMHPDVKKYLVDIYTRTQGLEAGEMDDVDMLCQHVATNSKLKELVYKALQSMPETRHIHRKDMCSVPVITESTMDPLYTGFPFLGHRNRNQSTNPNLVQDLTEPHRLHVSRRIPTTVAREISHRFVHPDEQGTRIPKRLGGKTARTRKSTRVKESVRPVTTKKNDLNFINNLFGNFNQLLT